jgi:hypothetical protein
MRIVLWCLGCVLAFAVLIFPLGTGAAAARNCAATPPNTGQLAPYGYEPNLVEVVFCSSRTISATELQQFQSKYQVILDHITSTGDGRSNVYIFRLQSGTPPDKVLQIAADDDVLTASVESLGQAAAPSSAPSPRALPTTTTRSDSSAMSTIVGAVALGLFILGAAQERRRTRT